ncbi:hypothetical protein Q3C01_09710 [Bradyrhizobium sp. UFLA05-109]
MSAISCPDRLRSGAAGTRTALLEMLPKLIFLVLQPQSSGFILLGHRPQPSRCFVMGKVVRDPATTLGMIEQGALLDIHLPTTRAWLNGPSLWFWNRVLILCSEWERVAIFSRERGTWRTGRR